MERGSFDPFSKMSTRKADPESFHLCVMLLNIAL